MNYQLHYNNLINRAKNRNLEIYTESHHIIPMCLGGEDHKTNLVELTPEEHFVAHQLLVKIYPENYNLIYAANMMCVFSEKNIGRSQNKLYGWLRQKLSEANSLKQTGEGNSQYGTYWISNKEKKLSRKIRIDDEIPIGWIKGRIFIGNINYLGKIKICEGCKKEFIVKNRRSYCSKECREKMVSERRPLFQVFKSREKEFLDLYKKYDSMNRALKEMGFVGAVSHYYKWAKTLI
jgi:hypothetical protein